MDVLPDDAPAPRLCHLIKWPDFDGYGFNLHAERSNPGQFVGKIDDDSPAQMAGLREGDRIVEVNGVNISNENHRQVVSRIKSDPNETKLLVVDQATDLWYREQDLIVKSSQMNVVYMRTPVPRPEPDSPRAKCHQTEPGGHEQAASSLSAPAAGLVGGNGSSSLDTSDFNDDSIERPPSSLPAGPSGELPGPRGRLTPPMSPDSGRGDELAEQLAPVALGGADVGALTVEAEINHLGIQQQQQQAAQVDEIKQQQASADPVAGSQAADMQPDSLSDEQHQREPLRQDPKVSNLSG